MRMEVKVGIFFIVSLVIFFVIVEFLSGIPLLEKEYSLKTYFESIGELTGDSVVKLNGVEIGTVSSIKIVDGKIEVSMNIEQGSPVKKDSVATIKLTSPVGTAYLNLTFGSPETPIASPGSVLPSEESTDLSDVIVEAKGTLTNINETFNSMFKETKETLVEARGALASINEISTSIKQGNGTLGKLVKDESLYNQTKETMTKLDQIADRLNSDKGTFGKFLNDETFYNKATEATTRLNSILEKVDKGEGTLGKLISDDSLYFDTQNAVKKVEKGVDTQEDLAPLSTLGEVFGILTIF